MNRGIRGFLIIGLLAGAFLPGEAMAMSKAEAKAEQVRLSEDMRRLAKRAHWRGVDRSYRSMEALTRKDVVLGYDDHFLGAQAARELGNVTLVYRRLVKAKAVNATPDVTNWSVTSAPVRRGRPDPGSPRGDESARKMPYSLTSALEWPSRRALVQWFLRGAVYVWPSHLQRHAGR